MEKEFLTNDEKLRIIKENYAKGATPEELKLFLYTAQKYDLDILAGHIVFVKYKDGTVKIYATRDGFIHIAHRNPQFDGFNTVVEEKDGQFVATCTVYRKDFSNPIIQTVWSKEYDTGRNLWATKKRTMIGKVSESQTFRKAFDIAGIYDQDEFGDIIVPDEPAKPKKKQQVELSENKNNKPSNETNEINSNSNAKFLDIKNKIKEFGEDNTDVQSEMYNYLCAKIKPSIADRILKISGATVRGALDFCERLEYDENKILLVLKVVDITKKSLKSSYEICVDAGFKIVEYHKQKNSEEEDQVSNAIVAQSEEEKEIEKSKLEAKIYEI